MSADANPPPRPWPPADPDDGADSPDSARAHARQRAAGMPMTGWVVVRGEVYRTMQPGEAWNVSESPRPICGGGPGRDCRKKPLVDVTGHAYDGRCLVHTTIEGAEDHHWIPAPYVYGRLGSLSPLRALPPPREAWATERERAAIQRERERLAEEGVRLRRRAAILDVAGFLEKLRAEKKL